MSLPKCLFPHFFPLHFSFLIICSLCCFGVLLSFDLNSNRLMPMATDNGISSAFTNDPVPMKAMPHNPTAAEEFPYEFWHENKPFVHIHGEEPNRHTMRHQHFVRSYFENAFDNFITDPPGMGLNTVMGQQQTKRAQGEEGLLEELTERNTEEEEAVAPNKFGGDEQKWTGQGGERHGQQERTREPASDERIEQKGDTTNDWKTNGGLSLWENQFSQMLSRKKIFDKMPLHDDKEFGHENVFISPSHPLPLQQLPSPWSTPSPTATAVFLRQKTMEPILRFYHRPKISPKANLSRPVIIVPASSSTLEHSAAADTQNTMGQRHISKEDTVIDADIPLAESADLKDAQPIGNERKKGGVGEAKYGQWNSRESAERVEQRQEKLVAKEKLVFKTDSIVRTTVVPTSVYGAVKEGVRMPCGNALQKSDDIKGIQMPCEDALRKCHGPKENIPMPCLGALRKCHGTFAGCDCAKCSAADFHCAPPKGCCCFGTNQPNGHWCSNCCAAQGRCCENAVKKAELSPPDILLTIRCCCCRCGGRNRF